MKYKLYVGQHNEQLHDIIDALWAQESRAKVAGTAGIIGELRYEYVDNRMFTAEYLTEHYFDVVGRLPSTLLLARLASYVLFDELTDEHPDKMTNNEYPFMSDSQQDERESKYSSHSDLQFGDRRLSGRRKTSFTDNDGAPQVRNNRIADPRDPIIEAIGDNLDLYDALENAGLTARQRQAIDLVYFDDMTQSAVARVMGVSQPAVAKFERQALAKLREYMTKY